MRVLRGDGALELEGEVLGWGSESVVYGLSTHPGFTAKVYHAPRPEHGRKLEAMLSSPPADPPYPAFTWPAELLRGEGGEVVGYLMPRVPRDRVPLAELFDRRTRRVHVPAFTYRELLWTARSLAGRVDAVHRAGHVVGDLDEGDLLVSADAGVTMVDTDSFQVRSPATGEVFRCPTAQPDLTPSELHGIRPAEVDRAPEHDRFGLAVLLFQLLMEGTHPFTGVCDAHGAEPSRAERIRAGEFAYAPGGVCRPAPQAPPFELLDPGVRALFARCFVEGHLDPAARPTASQWEHALARAEASLRPCDAHPRHLYGAHLAACPWCERARLVGGDPFPPSEDTLPRVSDPARAAEPPPRPESVPVPGSAPVRGPRTARVAPKTRKPRAETPAAPVSAAPPAVSTPAPEPAAGRPATSSDGRGARMRPGVNPFMGLALLLAVAGVIPPLREVAWGLALFSAVLGTVFAHRWGGAGQLQLVATAGVVIATLMGGRAIRRVVEERLPSAPVAVAPREEPRAPQPEPAPAPRAAEKPEPAPPPRATGRPSRSASEPRPRRAPKPRPASTPRSTPRSQPPSRTETRTTTRTTTRTPPRATQRPQTRRTSPPASRTTPAPRRTPPPAPRTTSAPTPRRAPAPTPRRTPPRAAAPAEPSAPQLTAIRGDLAVAQALKDQGAYYDAGVTLRGAQESVSALAARYPGARGVAELDQRVRSLTQANRRACQAEAAVLRSRGEPTSPCP